MKTTLLSILFLAFFTITNAEEIHVPADYLTIQEAIDASVDGDIIIVASGIYYENINFNGKAITVTSNFHFSEDINDVISTVINGSQPSDTLKGSCVTFNTGEDTLSVIKGFTITGGIGNKTYNEQDENWFKNGGGIQIDHCDAKVIYNIIEDNHCTNEPGVLAAGGGGIRMGFGEPIIANNIIRNNSGGYAGGIMIAYCGGSVLKNNIVSDNLATGSFSGGGGIYIDWEAVTLENNTIVNNHSGDKGGGVISTGAVTVIKNCIIYGNTATNGSEQIFKRYGGSANLKYTCIEGSWNGVGNELGMINIAPIFEDTINFYLNENSPCIDTGYPDVEYYDSEDPESLGNALFPAMGTITNDMGAYGGLGVLVPVSINDIGSNSDFNLIYENPYRNNGVTVKSFEGYELYYTVYSLEGKLITNKQQVKTDNGGINLPIIIDNSVIVVFENNMQVIQSIKLLKI